MDVLSLSATPIPRTLEMAVTGIREMSTLATPPEDRLPVLTYVGAYEDAQVTAAVRRELLRGGQVFYVHNRVQDIASVAAKIHELVPESHVGIAHGKMGEKQLDGVIRDFWHRDIDVLVCTTIIETGLDISNANTLIVDHADRFGLSQLHQLRGRVGRGRERAYAYFLYDPTKPMTQQSHDRLATIAQNTALGSGFDVAMKDLELRGTGNLLGDEQSGHIEGVGFDLYVRMVSEAVEQYKEPERTESVAVTIDLPIEASIPSATSIPTNCDWKPTASWRVLVRKPILTSCVMSLRIVTASLRSISRRCSMWRDFGSRQGSWALPKSSGKAVTFVSPNSSRENPCKCAWPESTRAFNTVR